MKKVVIIGGGFAGSSLAKKLESKFEVVLIDMKNYFEFTPSVLRTLVQPEHIKKIQVMHAHYLRKTKIILGKVSEISRSHVRIKNQRINFDYLAICSGSSYKAPFKNQNLVIAARAENLRTAHDKLCKAKKVLIIGGGLVGAELAGEIASHFGRQKEITIVHKKSKLIERNSEKAIKYAENYLTKRGVKIIFNEEIVGRKGNIWKTSSGEIIKTDLAFLCTGIKSNFEFMKKNFKDFLNEKNQIEVNEFLQLDGIRNIFAAGDVNNILQEKTAQNAERQAEIVAENICALEKNKKLSKLVPTKTTLVISLGKNAGILEAEKLTLTGFIPGRLKSLVEWKEMFKRKSFSY